MARFAAPETESRKKEPISDEGAALGGIAQSQPVKKITPQQEGKIISQAMKAFNLSQATVRFYVALAAVREQKRKEFCQGKGWDWNDLSEEQSRAAADYAKGSKEYKDAFTALGKAFDERNRALEALGFTSDVKYWIEVQVEGQTLRRVEVPRIRHQAVDIASREDLKENLRLFESMISPIILAAMDRKLLPEDGKTRKGISRVFCYLISNDFLKQFNSDAAMVGYITDVYLRSKG